MNERDLHPEQPAAWGGVDQVCALLLELRKLGGQVVDLVGDVMHPRASPVEEPADGRLGAERCDQLQAARADEQRHGLDTLLGLGLALLKLGAEHQPVARDRFVEILDCDADVVNALRGHCRDSI